MSRAFVKEVDDTPVAPPLERPVSAASNLVTPRGAGLIEQAIVALEEQTADRAQQPPRRAHRHRGHHPLFGAFQSGGEKMLRAFCDAGLARGFRSLILGVNEDAPTIRNGRQAPRRKFRTAARRWRGAPLSVRAMEPVWTSLPQ
jgi:hypothetical protein